MRLMYEYSGVGTLAYLSHVGLGYFRYAALDVPDRADLSYLSRGAFSSTTRSSLLRQFLKWRGRTAEHARCLKIR